MSFSGKVREEILEYYGKRKEPYLIKAERFGEYLTEAQYKSDLQKDYNDYFEISNLSEEEIKTVLKGVFLATGCIVDPNNDYRFDNEKINAFFDIAKSYKDNLESDIQEMLDNE